MLTARHVIMTVITLRGKLYGLLNCLWKLEQTGNVSLSVDKCPSFHWNPTSITADTWCSLFSLNWCIAITLWHSWTLNALQVQCVSTVSFLLSDNPRGGQSIIPWYVSFGLPVISPMCHIGVHYISELAVGDKSDQAADHSLSPQVGLMVLLWFDCIQQPSFSWLFSLSKEGTPVESDRNLTAPVRAYSLLTA